MAYKLFDNQGNEVKFKDLQEKEPWYEDGMNSENVFIEKYGKLLNLIINPEKKRDKYTVDILNIKTNNLGDLKTQHTPFFQALYRYSIDPQYAVTFNKKDYIRYNKYYPGIEIYFWIDWVIVKLQGKKDINVEPMEGVWKIGLDDIKKLVETAPLHFYQQRVYDFNNNKGSYVLNLNDPLFTRVI